MTELSSTPEFEIVMESARRIVAARAARVGLNPLDREDLLQDVMIKYLNAWTDGRRPDNSEAWLETTTANALTDVLRRNGREGERRAEADDADEQDDLLANLFREERISMQPSANIARKKILFSVFRLVDSEDAELLRERFVNGASAADLAARLGLTVAAVNQRASRAKARLRAAIEARPDLLKELRKPHPRKY